MIECDWENVSCMLIRIKMHNWPPSKWIIVWDVCWKTRYPQSRKIPPHKRINTSKGKAQRSIIASTLKRHNSANNHYRPRNNLLQMIFISEKTPPPPISAPARYQSPPTPSRRPFRIQRYRIMPSGQSVCFFAAHTTLSLQNKIPWFGGHFLTSIPGK